MNGQAVLVTGAASGIGRAVAVRAASEGWYVHVLDVDGPGAEETCELVRATGAGAQMHIVDVTDAQALSKAFRTIAAGPPLSGTFAGAGIDIGGPAHEFSPESWRRVLDVNATGSFLVVQQSILAMMPARSGSIVMCSSPAATVGFAAGGAVAYSASKGAISATVRALAVECAHHGIRVNAIVPGPTETPLMWANVAPEQIASIRSQIEREVPLGRLARPEEIAESALWLLSERASYTTGSLIGCDGGVLAKSSISV